MKVENMMSSNGNKVANQFVISEWGELVNGTPYRKETFQSYDSVIAVKTILPDTTEVVLDPTFWDYSKTTGKYRNIFLGETKAETEKKIKSGVYKLSNLN